MLRSTDIKRGLKAKFPEYTFRVHKHGYGWRLGVAGATEAEMPAIEERFQYILANPYDFQSWRPISATPGEIKIIRPSLEAK